MAYIFDCFRPFSLVIIMRKFSEKKQFATTIGLLLLLLFTSFLVLYTLLYFKIDLFTVDASRVVSILSILTVTLLLSTIAAVRMTVLARHSYHRAKAQHAQLVVNQLNQRLIALFSREEEAKAIIIEGLSLICDFYGCIQINYYHRENQLLKKLHGVGQLIEPERKTRFTVGEGWVGQCAEAKEPLMIHSTAEAPLLLNQAELGVKTVAQLSYFPVMSRGSVIGVAELYTSEHLRPSQVEEYQHHFFILAASLVGCDRQAEKNILKTQTEALIEKNQLLETQKKSADRHAAMLAAAQRLLKEKQEELERANHYKSEFLAAISHEIRTRLNILLVLSNQLANNQVANLLPQQIEDLHAIQQSGEQLLKLMKDVLDLSKVEAGIIDVSAEVVNIATLCKNLKLLFTQACRDRGLTFSIEPMPDLPKEIQTDSLRLEQILINLINNAIKYTASGGVTVKIERAGRALEEPTSESTVSEAALHDSGCEFLAFRVIDTGLGIASHQQSEIFKPFRRLENGTNMDANGCGLGLAISKKLAHLLSGALSVRSKEGEGACFTLLLPVVWQDHQPHWLANTTLMDQAIPDPKLMQLEGETQPFESQRVDPDVSVTWDKVESDPIEAPPILPIEGRAERLLLFSKEISYTNTLAATLKGSGWHVDISSLTAEVVEKLSLSQQALAPYDLLLIDFLSFDEALSTLQALLQRGLQAGANKPKVVALFDPSVKAASPLYPEGVDSSLDRTLEPGEIIEFCRQLLQMR